MGVMKWLLAIVEIALLTALVSLDPGFLRGFCIGLFVALIPYYVTAWQEDK